MSDLVKRAAAFAENAHRGQMRKYPENTPYIVHPRAVARMIAGLGYPEHMIAAALLHDVVEDCGVPLREIYRLFGGDVAILVFWLTDISTGMTANRAVRKEIDRMHIAKASPEAMTIKLADLIDNTKSIVAYDPKFAKIYLAEKRLLLEVLKEGDKTLWALAWPQLSLT
jgi:(p)ppGpp synthase/HD superfamily hydrolase